MDIKKPTNIIKAIDFYIPRFKGMETISQAKDEDTFAAFCHSQLSGGIGMKIRNEMGLWEDSDLKRHFEYVHNCKHPDDMSDLIIRGNCT